MSVDCFLNIFLYCWVISSQALGVLYRLARTSPISPILKGLFVNIVQTNFAKKGFFFSNYKLLENYNFFSQNSKLSVIYTLE